MSIINQINRFLKFNLFFTLLIFLLPFGNAFMYPFLVLSFVFYLKEKKYKTIDWKNNLPFIVFILLTLFFYAKGLISGTFIDDFDYNNKMFIIFFLFQFTLAYNDKLKGEKAFVLGVVVSITLSAFNMLSFYIDNFETSFSFSGNKVNELLVVVRPHLGVFIVTSLFIIFKNISKKIFSNRYYWLALLQIGFVIFISARLAIAVSLLLTAIHLFHKFKNNKKSLALFIVGLIALLALIINNPIFKERFKIQEGFKIDLEKTLAYEPRYVIYPCAVDLIINDVPFSGFNGRDKVQTKLNECYVKRIEREKKQKYYLNRNFGSHNALFNFTLYGGFFGTLFFMFLMLYPIFSKNFPRFTNGMIWIFISFYAFQNLLPSNHGAIFFGIFYLYYYKYSLRINNYDQVDKSAS